MLFFEEILRRFPPPVNICQKVNGVSRVPSRKMGKRRTKLTREPLVKAYS
jgi:hypothetical protein